MNLSFSPKQLSVESSAKKAIEKMKEIDQLSSSMESFPWRLPKINNELFSASFNQEKLASLISKFTSDYLSKCSTTEAENYIKVGKELTEKLKFKEAYESFNMALMISIHLHGQEHTEVATAHYHLGVLYRKQGKYREALENQKKALDIRTKALGPKHLGVAELYNEMGILYGELGQYADSLETHKKALNIRLLELEKFHSDIAQSYDNVGLAYWRMAKYKEALEYMQMALDIRINLFGDNHPDTADSYNHISLVHFDMRKYNQALETCSKALKIKLEKLGNKHYSLCYIQNNLGIYYLAMGKLDKASECHKEGLSLLSQLGPRHPEVATSMVLLGNVCTKMGNYNEAFSHLNSALKIRLDTFGEEHPSVAEIYHDLGVYHLKREALDDAIMNFSKAIQICNDIFIPKGHPSIAESKYQSAIAYQNKRDYSKALENLKESYNIYSQFFELSHPAIIAVSKTMLKVTQIQARKTFEKTIGYLC